MARPTKYKPEYCQTVLVIGEQGGWLSEMAEACDVTRATMDNWSAAHPEFLEALTRAKQKSQAWFERNGREAMFADKFNAALWSKQMSARHPGEYSEKHKLEHTGDGGGPVETVTRIELVAPDLERLADS